MKLNQKEAVKLEIEPGRAERREFDDALPGFGVRVRAGGKRTWIVQYRLGREQKTKTLGAIGTMDYDKAKREAKKSLGDVARGQDPQAQKRAARAPAGETFAEVSALYIKRLEERVAAKKLRPRSLEAIKTHLQKHWAVFRDEPIRKITQDQVAAHLRKMKAKDERGPIAALRARSTLATMFGWAMGESYVSANPVIGTNKPADEVARDRLLSDDELVAVWNAAGEEDYGQIVRLLILTGQRRDEMGGLARSEVGIDARKVTLPAARTKNGREHEVPLSDMAVGILEAALARSGREARARIFGEGKADAGFSGWSKAKAALDKRLGASVVPWRLHDLRRTAATGMAKLGALPHVVEAVLNHVSGHKAGVAGLYNHADYGPQKRQALDLWAAHVEALLAGKMASNVVPLRA